MKDYGFIFRDDKELSKKAKVISSLTRDISEYIFESLKLDIKAKNKKYKVAYHSACSMQHGQKVHSQPISLLEKTKNEILEIPEGTYLLWFSWNLQYFTVRNCQTITF
jgi:glycolate oxidase iron-sulfur subunit